MALTATLTEAQDIKVGDVLVTGTVTVAPKFTKSGKTYTITVRENSGADYTYRCQTIARVHVLTEAK